MKSLAFVLLFLGIATTGFSQGQVQFQNKLSLSGIDAPISYGSNGPAPAGRINGSNSLVIDGLDWGGTNARAGLYGGPAGTPEDQLVLLTPSVPFRTTPVTAGYVNITANGGNSTRTINGVSIQQPAVFQVRAWDCGITNVTSYEDATNISLQRPVYLGKSPLVNIDSLGGGSIAPSPLVGLQPFGITLLGHSGPPEIWDQSTNQVVLAGTPVNFQVIVAGTPPLNYHWYFNDAVLDGETNRLLAITNAQPENAGNYFAIITNAFGAATSQIASLTVTGSPPFILTEPSDQTVNLSCFPQPECATLRITPASVSPITIQWYSNGVAVPDAMTDSLDFCPAQPQDAATYQVIITNYWGAVTSRLATLIVNVGPTFTTYPASQTVGVNFPVTFSARAEGDLPITFQWLFNNIPINGANNEDYIIPSAQLSGAGQYSVIVSNRGCSHISQTASLVVHDFPAILTQPQSYCLLAGSDVPLSVTAASTAPVSYTWLFNETNVLSASSNEWIVIKAQPINSGIYQAVVSNIAGCVTSSPAFLDIRNLMARNGGQNLCGSAYTYYGPAQIELQTAFTNGSIFFTLDGSPPSFARARYTGPFTLARSGTLRALVYSADFTQVSEASPIEITIISMFAISGTTPGGGVLTINPLAESYPDGSTVTVSVTSQNGWEFLGWVGDAIGTNRELTITMNRHKCLEAVFGTRLSTSVGGNGTLSVDPAVDWYPYGTTVRVTAIPQSGNSFAVWGSAASGTNNPLTFIVTNANPTISCLFTPLSGGQVALTVLPNGRGRVTATPRRNTYNTGQILTLTALPDPDQEFVGWSGDATGNQTNLVVTMNQSKVISANFSRHPRFRIFNCLGTYNPEAFQCYFQGSPGERYTIYGSADLLEWTPETALTNTLGTVQYLEPYAIIPSHRFFRAVVEP